jgi:hypothetical protein
MSEGVARFRIQDTEDTRFKIQDTEDAENARCTGIWYSAILTDLISDSREKFQIQDTEDSGWT